VFATLSDVALAVSDILVDSNRIAVLSTLTTKDRTGWFGRPATGGAVEYRLLLLLTIVCGKIVRDERIYDSAGVVDRLEKAALDEELKTAAEVQRTLLARCAVRRRSFRAAGKSIPCRAIGGDFFDFVDLPSGDFGILMGDVSGKGPAAALLAALLLGMFDTDALAGGPAQIVSGVNRRLLARGLQPRYVTLVYAVLSPAGDLVYSNAGHNPPALFTRRGLRRLTAGGPVVGLLPDARYEEESLKIEQGDTLVMFTDGVIEARNAADEEFGEERLLGGLANLPDVNPDAVLEQTFEAIRSFCKQTDQADDISMTVARFIR
jgi:sigma-B regulation protein RsbU (phosphoserine phosphatase)